MVEDTYLLCPAPVLREVGMYVLPASIFPLPMGKWVWVSSLCSAVLFGFPSCHFLMSSCALEDRFLIKGGAMSMDGKTEFSAGKHGITAPTVGRAWIWDLPEHRSGDIVMQLQ